MEKQLPDYVFPDERGAAPSLLQGHLLLATGEPR